MTIKLSKLEKVDLRKVWKKEDRDFTPWLAKEENIERLANTIGMELEVEEEEKSVGSFSADILCKNLEDNSWVVIENQLERTDHKHLGQLLTYAAGLDATTVIWVAENFTEEHRAALDRLNEITNEDFHFFGLEVELWKIGESPPAPNFNIVSKPNDWKKETKNKRNYSEKEIFRKKYWANFVDYMKKEQTPLKLKKPKHTPWYTFSIGKGGFWFATLMQTRNKRIGVELCIYQPITNKSFFSQLQDNKKQIEEEIGFSLEWHKNPDKNTAKIQIWKNVDYSNQEDWNKQYKWLKEKIEAFYKIFCPRIIKLNSKENKNLEEESVDG